MTVVVSGGELQALNSPRRDAWPQGPLGVVPRLDRDGTIVDLERLAASFGDPEYVYRTQPAVRTVVNFRASRFIRVPLHAYAKQAEDDRQDLPAGDALAETIAKPREGVTQAQFIADLYLDWMLHDRWLMLVTLRPGGGYDLTRLPAWRWKPRLDGLGRVDGIIVDGRADDPIPPQRCIFDHGRGGGVSPMHTLQETLLEMIEGAKYRRQQWANGIRAKAVIERDQLQPNEEDWTDDERQRWAKDLGSRWRSDGPDAGGVPVLEPGMHVKTVDMLSAADMEYLEGFRLNSMFVASTYDTAPELLGWRPGNFSNMREYRQSLYRETLGGDYTRFEQKFQELVPLTTTVRGAYLEFLIEAALRGSFEEQAAVFQSSTGAPWLLRSEARAKLNLPAVEGMDEPVVPLNVLVGGLASPRDTARGRDVVSLPSAKGEKALVEAEKAHSTALDHMRDRLAAAISGVFAKQRAAVLDQEKAAPSPGTLEWDKQRWDAELRNVILGHGQVAAGFAAQQVLARLQPDYDWSDEPMLPWLAAAAQGIAERTNQATHDSILHALAQAEWRDAVTSLFDTAENDRALQLGRSVITETAGFGSHEAAKAVGARTKTWRVTSSHPRAAHAARDGETVPVDATFTGGLRWPGDSRGSADETAGCTCTIDYDTGGA